VEICETGNCQVLNLAFLKYQIVKEVISTAGCTAPGEHSNMMMDFEKTTENYKAKFVTDMGTFKLFSAYMVSDITIKKTSLKKLYTLFNFIRHHDSGVVLQQEMIDYRNNNCVLGFHTMRVEQPKFNMKLCEFLVQDEIWQCKETKKRQRGACMNYSGQLE